MLSKRVRTLLIPKPIKLVVFALIAACGTGGCGYHFAAAGDSLPADAKTIYVQQFVNRTRVTGINDEFMRYAKDEIAMHDRLQLVDDPAHADLELSGQITHTATQPINFNSVLEPTIYGMGLTVSAQLTDMHTNKVIWSVHNVSDTQHAPVVAQTVVTTTPSFLQQNLRSGDIAQLPDIQTAQTQTSSARDLMMKQVAKNLYAEMTEGF